MTAQDQVAALIAAQRVIDKPNRYRVTDAEIRAMAGTCLALAGLADRLALAIEGALDVAGTASPDAPDDDDDIGRALCGLRETYEQEFPDGQD